MATLSTITSSLALLAMPPLGAWGIGEFLIAAIIIIAIIAIFVIYLRVSGVQIPPWALQIVWIIVAAIVCIVAIRFVLSL